MKINQLSYYDHSRGWRLEPVQFSEFNLLVGASGVGKTQILQSIMTIQDIAKGQSVNGIEWDIHFIDQHKLEYRWQGKFETKKNTPLTRISDDEGKGENRFKITSEFLSKNGETIIERTSNEIKFKDKILPKLSPFQSAVAILSEEEDVSPVQDGLNKIIYSDQSRSACAVDIINYSPLIKKYGSSSLDKVQQSYLPIQIKLVLVYKNFPEIFNNIKEHFAEIFVQVEDLKLEPEDINDDELPVTLIEYPFIKIKEKGVNDWISQDQISSGMFRTLMHISELYLSAEGTVILIDEFENSLGVNCIDIVTELLLENRQLQFILTSHHPYIINKIGMDHWKIVTRKGGVVTARDAKDFNLGKSKHEAFMQLMNLDAYAEGITVE